MKIKLFISTLLLVILAVGAFAVNAQPEQPQPPERPGNSAGPRRVALNIVGILVANASDNTGLTPQEIRTQAQSGATLADVIVASGGNVDAVVQATLLAVSDRVSQSITDGTITQQQGEQILHNMGQVINRALSSEVPGRPGGDDRGARARGIVQRVAEATGLEPSQVVEQLQGGASLADVLRSNGVDVNIFINELIAEQTVNLRQRLEQALNQPRGDVSPES